MTNCLSVFDHFVGLPLKGLRKNLFFVRTKMAKISHLYTVSKFILKISVMFYYRHLDKKLYFQEQPIK